MKKISFFTKERRNIITTAGDAVYTLNNSVAGVSPEIVEDIGERDFSQLGQLDSFILRPDRRPADQLSKGKTGTLNR